MKQTISRYDFIDAFHKFNREGNFPNGGLSVLFDYLEDYEDQTGKELELDVIALCCDFSQLSFEEVEQDYQIEIDYSDCDDDEDRELLRKREVLEYIEYNTMVVGLVGPDEIIFHCF